MLNDLLAKRHDLPGLKSSCEAALVACLTSRSAVNRLVEANMHRAWHLKEKAIQKIVRDLGRIRRIPAWKELERKSWRKQP